jgi:hypothetical protein
LYRFAITIIEMFLILAVSLIPVNHQFTVYLNRRLD